MTTAFPLSWPDTMPIPGYPGYLATRDGRVISMLARPPKPIRQDPDRDGYPYVLVRTPKRRKRLPVHRAVALAFLGHPRPGQQVRHLDGDRSRCCVDNLAWGTPLENSADRDAHGNTARGRRNGAYTKPHRRPRGAANGMTKVTPHIVAAIRSASGRQKDIGARFGVSQQLVSLIRRGEVHPDQGGSQEQMARLTDARDRGLKQVAG